PVRAAIVMPTYEEARNIGVVLPRVRAAAPEADVVVVDDASPDGTADLAEAVGREAGRVTVMRRTGPRGFGAACRAGFGWAVDGGYDVVVGMDADLSHDPAALPFLLAAVEAGADLVVGSRYVPGGAIPDWPVHRRALSRWGNRYATALLRLPVSDATSGYRAYRSSMLRRISLDHQRANGYGFLIEMVYRVAQQGGTVVEVPIVFVDRERDGSKMSGRIVVEAMVLVTLWGLRDLARRLSPARRSTIRLDRTE
ncbi:MAG TPA: polyprenol monophosphomannose synthase, partial [Acidimicrobiales bacterium]|nr:polyprenol monophosphomannose synthase [Acidimicrobiales bacterium]